MFQYEDLGVSFDFYLQEENFKESNRRESGEGMHACKTIQNNAVESNQKVIYWDISSN